ncbi:Thiazole synthase [Morganella morganii]|nr:Thiazole synthase [Morganella morganii]
MLTIADTIFTSHLFTGTGKYTSSRVMQEAIAASGSQLVTMAMKRIDLSQGHDDILAPLRELGIKLLPNTSGANNAREAVFAAQLGAGGARHQLDQTGDPPRCPLSAAGPG